MELNSSHVLLQIAEGDNGKSASLETLSLVPLVERQQCDGCASCITDVHRTCNECGYDVCIRCCRGMREQGQVSSFQDVTCPLLLKPYLLVMLHLPQLAILARHLAVLPAVQHGRDARDSLQCSSPQPLPDSLQALICSPLEVALKHNMCCQDVVCGKCDGSVHLHLVRRFKPSDDTTLASIDEVTILLADHGVYCMQTSAYTALPCVRLCLPVCKHCCQ